MNDSSFFVHNLYMAEIADCIINDGVPLSDNATIMFSKDAYYQHGVREIIGLYLLIPYINNEKNQLQYDEYHRQLSVYDDKTVAFKSTDGADITIKNLRDTICHSFVSCDLLEDGQEPVIVFDDRIVMPRSDHKKLENSPDGTKCILVSCSDVRSFLKQAFREILSVVPKDK